MVNSKKIPTYENKLREIRNELIGGVGKNLKSSQAESNQNVPDISDEAARDCNNELMLNLGQQDGEKLKLVDEALVKIESGGYGICQQCEESIPEARLKIVPFAQYCVKCLESIEKGKTIERQHPAFGSGFIQS